MMEPLHVRMMGSGNNWMNVSGIIAVAINSYYSPLPPGSLVSVTTLDPGVGSMDGPKMVGEGKARFTRAYALRKSTGITSIREIVEKQVPQPISENWEALFDEAIMTPRWKNLSTKYE